MKRLVSALVFLAASLLTVKFAPASVPHLPEPYVVSDTEGNLDRCGGPEHCYGRLLVVRNPQRDPVTVVAWCLGDQRSETEMTIPPRSAGTFDLQIVGRALLVGDCTIARWHQ